MCYDASDNNLSSVNPITYRSYYSDLELGMYYLNSRYYMPALHRFLNADGYVSTGQGMLGHNMFAYCLNNPVNMSDPDGHFAISGITIASLYLIAQTCIKILAVALVVVTCAVVVPQVSKGIAQGVGNAVNHVNQSISSAKAKAKEKAKAKAKEKDATVPPRSSTNIYRYGGTNPGNLTPKTKDKFTGLSFSTIPMPGAAKTTIEELNATGLVYAVRDGATHVSVRPIGGTMDDWINAGPNSVWTQAVKSAVIKWDGEN